MLRSLASLFLDPLYFFYLLVLLGLVLYLCQYHRKALFFWSAAAIWYLLISLSPFPAYLALARENRFPVLSDVSAIDTLNTEDTHIVVLGGGHTDMESYFAYDRLSEPALKRLLEGVRLHNELPGSKLLCSGFAGKCSVTQAETLAETALMYGVLARDTLLQPAAMNTRMEALHYQQRFGNKHPLIVVTSALHMPRAVYWFKYYGLDPIPAPTNHIIMNNRNTKYFTLVPTVNKISLTGKLLHEYAGMLHAYLITGNTTSSNGKEEGTARK
ncbi:MAG: ElyC/SanA/YdcF family protein [Bacteroidota bacterium]